MGMDLDSITKGLGIFSSALSTLKTIKELIPAGDRKKEFEIKIEETEKAITIAQAEIAKGLDFQLCHRHFPPGIMLEIGEFKSQCNICGNIEKYDA